MGSNGADEVMISGGDSAECSETTVEIKIKTLDSQTYTLRVNKRMPVPALKEQIATVTGVLSEQQRLICRGKVLKDDQLLSAYHVEDGHTLHMVVGQTLPPSSASTTGTLGSESLPDLPATDPASGAGHSRGNHVAHSVVLGTFNIADQGDGVLPDLNRIVSAVLSSIGITNVGGGSEGIDLRESGLERVVRTSGVDGISDSTRLQPDQATMSAQSDSLHGAFRFPTAVSLGSLHPPVIPDSLATLSQYLSHMRHEFSDQGRGQSNNVLGAGMHGSEGRESDAASQSSVGQGLPTPASLANVMLSTRQLLIEQAGECLSQLIRQLEDQSDVTDLSVRMGIQSNAMRSGVLLQNLGALLLELGRTTMTLRMGQTPSEAVVNAGPAVFVSTSGPNPIMVQPLPFQPGTSFGAVPMGTVHPGPGLAGGTLGSGFLPRNIDIRIRTGSSMHTVNVNQGEQQPPGRTEPATSSGGASFVHQAPSGASGTPSFTGESGVRVVPIRTVVAAIPSSVSRPQSDPSGSSVGLFYPLLARVQHVTSGRLNNTRDSQASGELHPRATETERLPISESAVLQQNVGLNIGALLRDGNSANIVAQHQQGSLPIPNSRREQPFDSNSNNLLSGGRQNVQESATQLPSRFDQLLSTIFPGEQIRVGDVNFQGMGTGSATEHAATTTGAADANEAASGVGFDEGIFFSSMVRQLMPFISGIAATGSNAISPERADTSEQRIASDSIRKTEENPDVGTSRRLSVSPPTPNSKRQKRE